jgi:predicted chitinase
VGDFKRITLRINGGTNGMDDRLARFKVAQEVLA